MLSKTFLALSLVGAEWVLYLLVILSIFSVAIILERAWFYLRLRSSAELWASDLRASLAREDFSKANEILKAAASPKVRELLIETSDDRILQRKINWERNLPFLATIGNNAPFIGLFGTVLGIIQAFHDLSTSQSGGAAPTVTAGISEALVATAVGLLVAIPASIFFNVFSRKVRTELAKDQALQAFLKSHKE